MTPTLADPREPGDRNLSVRRVLVDGAIAGGLGAIAVVAVHGVFDVLAGDRLRTPALLAGLVFDGAAPPPGAAPGAERIAQYTTLHLALWLVAGVGSALLVSAGAVFPRVWALAFSALAFAFLSLLYLAGAFSVPAVATVPLWVGTLAGSAALLGFLAWRNPSFLKQAARASLSPGSAADLAEALAGERRACGELAAAAARFPTTPVFAELVAEKERHVGALLELFDRYDLAAPAPPRTPVAADSGSLADSLRGCLERERELLSLYGRLATAALELPLRSAYLRLQAAIRTHALPALERALGEAG